MRHKLSYKIIFNAIYRKAYLLQVFLYIVLSSLPSIAEKRVYFCDKLTKEPLEYTHIRGEIPSTDSWTPFSRFSDSTGVVILPFELDTPIGYVNISRVGYSPGYIGESTIGGLPDTIFLSQNTTLDMISISDVYQRENGKIIYNVEADSEIQDGNGLHAINRTPSLYNYGWEILSENKPRIIFKLNGASDFTLTREPGEFVKSIPAKYLKRIEVDENVSNDYGAVIVNIIAKNRIIGIQENFYSDISNYGISNTFKLQARSARVEFDSNIGYVIKKLQNVTRSTKLTPENKNTASQYARNYNDVSERYHAIRNENIITYNIDGSSKLTGAFRTFFNVKTSPKCNTASGSIYDFDNGTGYEYTATCKDSRIRKYEISANVVYAKELGYKGSKGNLRLLYSIYDYHSSNLSDFDYGGSNLSDIPDMLFDYAGRIRGRNREHIVNAEFSRNFGSRHYLSVSAVYQSSYQLSKQQFVDSFISDAAPVRVVPDDYSFPYTTGYFNVDAYYRYNAGFLSATVGGSFTHNSYKADYLSTDYSARLRSRFNDVSPYAKLYLPIDGYGSASLSYNSLLYSPPVYAMRPYVSKSVPGQITYGNWNCAPQHTHNVSLETSGYRKGWSTGASLTATFTNDLLATHRFMHDDMLHITYGNIARERTLRLGARVSKSFGRNLYASINGAVSHIDLCSGVMSQHNSGFYSSIRGNVGYDFNDIVYLTLEGSCSTSSPILHGKMNGRHSYGVDLSRTFGQFEVSLYANNFLTPYRTIETRRQFDGYKLINSTRFYQAEFGISLAWHIGWYKISQGDPIYKKQRSVKSNLDD